MKVFGTIENPKEIREKIGLTQSEFWAKVGVTQSGGSRYESGRRIPKAVRELVRIVHMEKIELNQINANDLKVGKALKANDPDLYKKLKK